MLTFEWDFPSGQCDPVTTVIANPDSAAPTVTIGMRYTSWRHWAIKLNGASGVRPIFVFNDNDYAGEDVSGGWRAFYTYDDPGDVNANWQWWDTDWTRDDTTRDNTGQLSAAFTSDVVYVSFMPLHTLARNLSHIQKIKADHPSLIHLPPSNIDAADWSSGTFASFTDGEGRTVPELPMRAFILTDKSSSPDDGAPKRKVVLTNGIHAGEHSGGYAFEGFINYVLNSVDSAGLLKNFEFFCYPNINPKGRYEGERRQNSQSTDLNRDWSSDSLTDGYTSTKMLKQIIDTDIPDTKISANFDFHTAQTAATAGFHWFRDTKADPAYYDAFLAEMHLLDPDYTWIRDITDNTLNNYLWRKYQSLHAYIPEVDVDSSFPNGVADIEEDGANCAASLYQLFIKKPDQFKVAMPITSISAGNVTTHTITGLDASTPYEYRIKSSDGTNDSLFTEWQAVTTGSATGPTPDTTAPVVTVNNLTTSDTTPTVTGTCDDDTANLTLIVNAISYYPTVSSGSWSQALNTLAVGSYPMDITATDAAGNTGTSSATLAITEVSTGPAGTLTATLKRVSDGQAASNLSGLKVSVRTGSNVGSVVYATSDETTDANGVLTLSGGSMQAATEYYVTVEGLDGSLAIFKKASS